MAINNLYELFLEELRDLYSAESQLLPALEEMNKQSTNKELGTSFLTHHQETREHVTRLQEIATMMDFTISGHECMGIKGILDEAKLGLKEIHDHETRDAALIAFAQRVEHYEISGYGTVIEFASKLRLDKVRELLKTTVKEEIRTDELLSKMAKGGLFTDGINEKALE